MIYLTKQTKKIAFPRISEQFKSADTLRLEGTIDHTRKEIGTKVVAVTPLIIQVSVSLPELPSGEYHYELLNRGEMVSSGLAIVEMGNNEYKQYGEIEEYIQA